MKTVTFSQLRNNAKKYFDAVEQGETVEVYRHGKPVAVISPTRERFDPGQRKEVSYQAEVDKPEIIQEARTSYVMGKESRLLETPRLSGTRELLRDRGQDVIPISYTKRFIQENFGVLGTGGKLLKALMRERAQEKKREDQKWRRKK